MAARRSDRWSTLRYRSQPARPGASIRGQAVRFSVDQDFSAMRRYYVQALSRLRAATEAPANT
jgi:hypothetical protein